jgi:hypothetical protein
VSTGQVSTQAATQGERLLAVASPWISTWVLFTWVPFRWIASHSRKIGLGDAFVKSQRTFAGLAARVTGLGKENFSLLLGTSLCSSDA